MRQSKYLTLLQQLKDEIGPLTGLSAIGVRMKRIQRYFDAAKVARDFADLRDSIAKGMPSMDNCGIDYAEWAEVFKDVELSAENHRMDYDEEYIKTFMNYMQDHLEESDRIQLTPEIREKMTTCLSYVTSKAMVSDDLLDNAFARALSELRLILLNIAAINEDKEYPRCVFPGLYKRYENTFKNNVFSTLEINSKYKSFKSNLVYDLTLDILISKRWEVIKNIFDSGFFCDSYKSLPIGATSSEKIRFEKETTLSDGTVLLEEQYLQMYSYWRQFFDYSNNCYANYNYTMLGRHIYKNRVSLDDNKVIAFVSCLYYIELIQYDIMRLMAQENTDKEAKIDVSKYENLTCSYKDEEIGRFGIKEHPKEIFALIEQRKEKLTKGDSVNWYAIYAVLLKYELIDDNVSRFCKTVNALFDVGLDNSNMSANFRRHGKDYTLWPDDSRVKPRIELAKEFDADIDGLYKYFEMKKEERLQQILSE